MKIAIILLLLAMGLPVVVGLGPVGILGLVVLLFVAPQIFDQF